MSAKIKAKIIISNACMKCDVSTFNPVSCSHVPIMYTGGFYLKGFRNTCTRIFFFLDDEKTCRHYPSVCIG